MLARITKVRYLGGYTLELTFNTGESGIIDYADRVASFRGVLAALRDQSFFAQVSVDNESGTICWPGDIDFCPDSLYSRVTGTPIPGSKPEVTTVA
jgi:hypothetical protein